MNNNFGFSKNIFGGGTETKIAGNTQLRNNTDGGRMSVEEVRNAQIAANSQIHPGIENDMNFRVDMKNNDKVSNPNMTPNQNSNMQASSAHQRMQNLRQMNNMNGGGFGGFRNN